MTREFIEKVFSQIPKCVEVAVFGLENTACGEAEICVSLGYKNVVPRDKFSKSFVFKDWATIAIDDEMSVGWKDVVAKAERLSLQADEEIRQMQKG